MKELRILIFSATFGAGHVRAAQALIEAVYDKDPDTLVTHLDFGEFLSKTINKVIKSTYIELIKHTPRLWGKFYYRTAKIPPDSVFQRFLNGLGRRELMKIVRNFTPDLIICTYPTVAGVLARLREKQILNIPIVTVVTDYAVHSQWIHPGVDLYIVGCQDVYEGLIARGISPDRIRVTGIPVSPKFERVISRQDVVKRLGLIPGRSTFLIMGGAYGVLDGAKKVCKLLANTEFPVQAIVVCGQDERLYKSLDSIVENAKNPIVRYGFVSFVDELMSAADVIITKAGGLTVSEALTKRLPLVIYKPIPGQEEENSVFLSKIGAGKVAYDEDELVESIYSLLKHPEQLEAMSTAARYALPGRAAEEAVNHIFELIGSSERETTKDRVS